MSYRSPTTQNQGFLHRLLVATVYLLVFILTMGSYSLSHAISTNKDQPAKATLDPNSSNNNLLYMLLIAEIAASRNMQSLALNYYFQAAKLSKDPAIAEQSTILAINLQAPYEAIISAKQWAKTDPNNLHAQLIAMTLLIGNSVEEATPFLERALKLDPTHLDQHLIEIQVRLSDESAKNLQEALDTIAKSKPNNPYAHLIAAESAAELGDVQNANQWVGSALKLLPDLTRAVELKARLIRHETKSDKTAIQYLSEHLKRFPNNHELRLFYAGVLLETEKEKEAKQQLMLLVEDKSFGGQALLLLGEIYLIEDQLQLAADALQKALQFSDSKNEAQYLLGEVEERKGEIEKATQWYTSVEEGPYHVPGVIRAVFLLKMNHLYSDAIYLLHNSTPTTIDEQKQLILAEIDILNSSKQSEEAMQLANEVLTKLPDDNDMLFIRAITATKLKKWALAEADLKKVLKQNPNNPHILNSLGYVLSFNKARLNEALNYLTQALALAPNNPSFMDSLGWAYFRSGNVEDAFAYLEKANSMSDDGEIAAHFGEVLWANNQKSEAMEVWNKALEQHTDHEILLETIKRLNR